MALDQTVWANVSDGHLPMRRRFRKAAIQLSISAPFHPSIHASIHPSLQPSFILPSIYLPSIHLYILPSNQPSLIFPSIYPFFHPSILPTNHNSSFYPLSTLPFILYPFVLSSLHLPTPPSFPMSTYPPYFYSSISQIIHPKTNPFPNSSSFHTSIIPHRSSPEGLPSARPWAWSWGHRDQHDFSSPGADSLEEGGVGRVWESPQQSSWCAPVLRIWSSVYE